MATENSNSTKYLRFFVLFLICTAILQWHSVSISLYPKWCVICSHSIYKLSTEYFVRIDGTGPKQCCITAVGAITEQGGDKLSHFTCYATEKSSLNAPTACL